MAHLNGTKTHPANVDPRNLASLSTRYLTPYTAIRRLGWQTYRHTGAIYQPELFIAFFLRCLRNEDGSTRAFYDNNKRINLRRHVFLLGDKDTKKGSSIQTVRSLFPVAHYSDDDKRNCLVEMTAQGRTTWEAMVGGAQDGQLLLPSVIGVDIITIEEGMSFFGHNKQSMMRQVDNFNGALQEGDIVNDVKNMKGASPKQRAEFRTACEDVGVTFNTDSCVMRFYFLPTAILASREPDFEAWVAMLDSGFISRLAIADCNFDPIIEREYYDDQFGDGDPEVEEYLKGIAALVWSCRFKRIDSPPMSLLNSVVRSINEDYFEIAEQTEQRVSEFKTGREHQYLSQLMTFNAVCRLIRDGLEPNTVVESIEYTEEDATFAEGHFRKFLLPYIERRARRNIANTNGDKVAQHCVNTLERFVRSKFEAIEDHVIDPVNYQVIDGGELREFMNKVKKSSPATLWRNVARLEDLGHITEHSRGDRGAKSYLVADRFIRDVCRLETMDEFYERVDNSQFAEYALLDAEDDQ